MPFDREREGQVWHFFLKIAQPERLRRRKMENRKWKKVVLDTRESKCNESFSGLIVFEMEVKGVFNLMLR